MIEAGAPQGCRRPMTEMAQNCRSFAPRFFGLTANAHDKIYHRRPTTHDKVPIIASLRRRDESFYADDEQCRRFLYFLCLQNLRTKGVRDRVATRTTEVNGFSITRCWNILRHMFAANSGAGLYLERKQRPLLVLENDTGLPFITGDQPIVNLVPSPDPDKPPELLAFYYPVSPATAIILDEVAHRCGYTSGPVSTEQFSALNRRIHNASHSQVFGSSREILESLRS